MIQGMVCEHVGEHIEARGLIRLDLGRLSSADFSQFNCGELESDNLAGLAVEHGTGECITKCGQACR